MKAQFLKMAGVNSEEEFYNLFPSEDDFFAAYPEAQMMRKGGEMIRRADGSYSKRGLWDNIRANRGSGKKPTAEMLEQERKIRAEEKMYGGDIYAQGGTSNPGFEALPDYVKAKILSNMGYGGFIPEMASGGYTVTRSDDRKGKTHKVTGPDGTVKYFGDSKMGQHPGDPDRKAAFYARHKKNLDGNPFFRAFARATWEEGGDVDIDKQALQGLGNIFSKVSDVLSIPARAVVKGLTGKYQDPSQAMGISNPLAAWLTDSVLDPANLVGAGVAAKVLGTAGKASKVAKVAKVADAVDRIANTTTLQRQIPVKKIPTPGNISHYGVSSQDVINALTERGAILDQRGAFKKPLRPDDIEYFGTYGGRPVVGVNTVNGPEYFYKSTSWGGKKEIKPGDWQAFGQWMDVPTVDNWFIKGKGFENLYGSQTFKNIAGQMDDAIVKKYGVPKQDLDKFLNFQNVQGPVNTFTPGRAYKEGGQTRDEREMVIGIADILSQVQDPQNRAMIAQNMMKDFKRENVTYDPVSFMKQSQVMRGGGSTYSGGVWFRNGGQPMAWGGGLFGDMSEEEMLAQANNDSSQTDQAAGYLAQTANKTGAIANKLSPMQKYNKQLGSVYNKMADNLANPYSATNMIGMFADVIEGVNAKKDYDDKLDKMKMSYSTDQAFGTKLSNAQNRGNYDMYNTFRPNMIGGNLSYTGMNQAYHIPKPFELGGQYDTSALSWVPKELDLPVDVPFFVAAPKANTFEMAPTKTASPEVEKVTRMNFNLSGNFQDYAGKAQRYLDKVAPGTDISGADLAAAAQQAYQKHGEVVPVELALAQLTQEGYLAKGKKPNKPQRTKNPFNVGNTDSGATVTHSSPYDGILAYYNLMASNYLKGKTPDQLLNNFVNKSGNRYASDKRYENSLKKIISSMKMREGGEYELTEDQIMQIRAMGGEVEFM